MLYTDNIGLKKPAYSDPADIADINENSDIIDREFGNRYLKSETYSVEQADNAIAQAIEALPNGLVYRGAVNYYKDLPTTNNELGDTYSVKYQGETGTTADGNEYAWGEYDGALQWIKLGVNAYTKNEIDEQHEVIKSDILKVQSDVFDRLKNLKDLLSKLHGAVSYPVTANGSFNAGGVTENITNRIRTDIISVKAGDVIEIVNGSFVHGCGIWKGAVNSTNIIRNDSSPKNTNENVIIEYDGNIVITFLHSNNENISPSDFDGSVTLYRKST